MRSQLRSSALVTLLVHCLAVAAGWTLSACGEDKAPSTFSCDCEADEVCRDGTCVPRGVDLGADAGDLADFSNPACPSAGLLISEVLYAPSSGEPEFVELSGPAGLDLTGFELASFNGNGGTELDTVLLAGAVDGAGFFVVATAALAGADQLAEGFAMQNGPDSLELRDCTGRVVDALGYGEFGASDVFQGEGTPAPSSGTGRSLARCPGEGGDDGDTNDNGADFHVVESPTPGGENDNFSDPFVCEPCEAGAFDGLVVISELVADPAGADTAEGELVELFGASDLDLFGLSLEIVDSDGEAVSLALTGSTDGDGFYVLGGPDPDQPLRGSLPNTDRALRLADCAGEVVDAVAYGGDGASAFGEGTALEGGNHARCPGAEDTDDNATDFEPTTGGSPGAENDTFVDPLACEACTPGSFDGLVIISELVADPPGTDTAETEFVELAGPAGLPLGGLTLALVNGTNGDTVRVPLTGSVGGDGRYTLGGPDPDQALPGSLQNGPDAIQLVDCGDGVVDALAYGGDLAAEYGEGEAALAKNLARCPDAEDGDDNASDFHEVLEGTPGAENGGFVDVFACSECPVGAFDGRVVINEIIASGDAEREMVELLGPPSTPLTGLQLVFVNGSNLEPYMTVPLTGSTDASGFYLVGAGGDDALRGSIQNGPDAVQLVDCAGAVVDAVAYGGADAVTFGEGDAVAGIDVARCPGGVDSDDNAADFQAVVSPTPGFANAGFGSPVACVVCEGGRFDGRVVINEVLFNSDGADSVENEFIELRGDVGLELAGLGVELVDGNAGGVYGTIFLRGEISSEGFYTVGSPVGDQALPFTMQNGPDALRLVDCAGEVVDALGYGGAAADPYAEGTAAPAVGDGESLARCAGPFAFIDGDVNAGDFIEDDTPTPAATNDACTVDE